jgi:ubiquinone biosynthesis protein Coq4
LAIEFGGDNLSESIIDNSVNIQPKQIQLQHLPNNLGKTGDIKSAINLLQVPSNLNQLMSKPVTGKLNMPQLSTLPDPTPIMIPNSLINTNNVHPMNEQHFNVKVNYNGQVHQNTHVVIPDLKGLETKLQNLDKLNDTELEEGK